MKITSLLIENWGAIGSAHVRLDDQGLILIQGINLDDTSQISNGAGKSTIAEALSWALFDETAKTEGGDKVVNIKEGKNAAVIVELLDENTSQTWRISRYRKHAVFKNQLRLELQEDQFGTIVWLDKSLGTDKLTQVLVNQVIGCDYEVFKAAIYAGQEAMPDLPAMTDKQLKVLVEEAAGIAQLQTACDIATRVVKERKAVVAETTGKIQTILAGMNALEESIKAAEEDRDAYEVQRADSIKNREADIATAEAAHDATMGPRLEAGITKIEGEIADIVSKIAGTEAERTEERRLYGVLNDANIVHASAQMTHKAKIEAAQQAKHKAEHVGDTVGSKCRECGHTIEAGDLVDSEQNAKDALALQLRAAQTSKAALESAQKAVEDATAALDAYRAAMTDISAQNAAQSVLSEKKAKLAHALANWKQAANWIDELKAKNVEVAKSANPYTKTIDDAQARHEKAKLEVDVLDDLRLSQQRELEVAERVQKAYGPAGVRAHILDTVTPHLNSRTAHYLSSFTDGNVSAVWSTISKTAKGELREKFVIDVASKTGGESFKSLSGGEKRKVRLACAMALQDLVASRASKPINLWIADEIDHALDSAGLERLMSILEEKARDKGTVLVISHTDLTDSIRESITVVKEHGKSTIRV